MELAVDTDLKSMEALAGRIAEHVAALRVEFVAFLRELVRLESPSHVPEAQVPVYHLLAGAFETLGFHTAHLPGEATGGHLYARPQHRRRSAPTQLLVGHYDTVWPLGTLRKMPAELDGDVLRGPGVFDMKAGVAMIVFALRTLHELGLEPAVTPVILLTSDEEIGSAESQRHIERLARCANRALILEPGLGLDGKIKTARKGTGQFEVIVTGRPAHAGLEPEKGASAILEMAHVIQTLHALNDFERGVTVNVGTIEGGMRTNIVAPESRITVDVRVPTRAAQRTVEATLRSLTPSVDGVSLEVRGAMDRPPMERTPRNQALWDVCRHLGRSLGMDLEEGLSGGGSDGNFTSLHTATLDGLGAVGDGAHAYHEFVRIGPTLERCALLALLLLAPPLEAA